MNKTDEKKIGWDNITWPLKAAAIYSWLMILVLVYYFFKGYFLGGQ